MPEGPELHVASKLINGLSSTTWFVGAVTRSDAAVAKKWPSIDFQSHRYHIEALTRGKELKMWLKDAEECERKVCLRFRFGMSGSFVITRRLNNDEVTLPRHAHLTFTTCKGDALSYVDPRRFGSYVISEEWGLNRGPDPILEQDEFRANVMSNLDKKIFDMAICEVLLDQKYFNGIGNYLRAEILYRARIPPFTVARDVLKLCRSSNIDKVNKEMTANGTDIVKKEPDLIDHCSIVPQEVLALHDDDIEEMYSDAHMARFTAWLQCYSKSDKKNLVDRNNRTIWFDGQPGELVPKGARVRRQTFKSSEEHDYTKKVKTTTRVKKEVQEEEKETRKTVKKPSKTEKSELDAKESIDGRSGYRRSSRLKKMRETT